ncbi:MAG: CAP domain-containing protein [Acidobacteriota bacterium]|nr:CAP domain-containing protein [Acidobacteriota bacterium]
MTVLALVAAGCDTSPLSPTAPQLPPGVAINVDLALYDRLNDSRQREGLPPVVIDNDLSLVAELHSQHMRDNGSLTHQDRLGGRVGDRLSRSGVAFFRAAENIGVAIGHADPAEFLHTEFMKSAPHRRIILDPTFSVVVIGTVTDGTETWVTEIFVTP